MKTEDINIEIAEQLIATIELAAESDEARHLLYKACEHLGIKIGKDTNKVQEKLYKKLNKHPKLRKEKAVRKYLEQTHKVALAAVKCGALIDDFDVTKVVSIKEAKGL